MFYTLLRLVVFSSQLSCWETRLNSDDYKEREASQAALLKQGSLQLCHDLVHSKYPEVRRRALVVYWYKKEAVLKSLEPCPCLDTLWYDCDKKHYDYTHHPRCKKLKCYIDYYYYNEHYGEMSQCTYSWPAYRLATRHWSGKLIDDGYPVWWIRVLHREMHRRDKMANCYYK